MNNGYSVQCSLAGQIVKSSLRRRIFLSRGYNVKSRLYPVIKQVFILSIHRDKVIEMFARLLFILSMQVLAYKIASATVLKCIECSQTYFNGDGAFDECYALETSAVVNETNCIARKPDSYCYTKIELSDGILSYIERGCTNPRTDELHGTNEYPDSVKCATSYSTSKKSRNIQQTECYIPCKGDGCNNIKIVDGMKPCSDSCPANTECNYLTGKCQCGQNRHGSNCSSNMPMADSSLKCVQCNSKTNSQCVNETESTPCQNGESHCSTTQTWMLKSGGTVQGEPLITRSCTNQYISPDRCYLTPTGDIQTAKYTEYTCVSTCSADGCNTGIANGFLDGEFIPMKCVVCEGDEKNCGPKRTLTTDCPAGTSHCSTSITYWETIINDTKLQGRLKPEASVSVRRIKRQCASSAVTPKCIGRKVGLLSLQEITCQEACKGDGCNTGWPNRPKCLQCSSEDDGNCFVNPPLAKDCPSPHHQYCYAYLRKETSPHTTAESPTIVRGCSRYAETLEEFCKNVTDYNRPIGIECTGYCTTDGCNFKNFDSPLLNQKDGTNGVCLQRSKIWIAFVLWVATSWLTRAR